MIPGGLFHHMYSTCLIKVQMRILSNAFEIIYIGRSFVEVLWFGLSKGFNNEIHLIA